MTGGGIPVQLSERAKRPLRILLVLRAANYDRMFERLIRGLLARGHTVHVVAEGSKRLIAPGFNRIFDAISGEDPNFSWAELGGPRRESWMPLASALRRSIDCLRFLEPEFADAAGLYERARLQAPLALRLLIRVGVLKFTPLRHGFDRALRALERALPASKIAGELLDRERPDVLLLAPFIGLGESQADYLRVAQARGIPAVVPIPSWDNLTNKGVIRDIPDLTIVWNRTQVKEAVELHGLPPERVLATGAHSFDHWFAWRPSRAREAFLETTGLPDRPFLMYVCSSSFIAGRETDFVDEWISRMRRQAPPELAEVGVLVRPHPQNTRMWHEHELKDPWAKVWPPKGAVPSDDQHKSDYYDSLYHSAAVVGINTSALLEAAIVRRSVFTIRTDEHRHSQAGTVHFRYLTGEDGDVGVLRAADSWEEHFTQLSDELRADGRRNERIERFLVDFLRPNGLDRPAAPFAVGAIERVVDQPRVEPRKPGIVARIIVKALVLVSRPIGAFSRWIRQTQFGLWIAAKRARDHKDAERARKALEKAHRRRVRRRQRVVKAIKRTRSRTTKRMRRLNKDVRSRLGLDPRKRKKTAKPAKASKPAKAEKQPKPKKAPKPAKAEKPPKPKKAPKPPKAERPRKPKAPDVEPESGESTEDGRPVPLAHSGAGEGSSSTAHGDGSSRSQRPGGSDR